MKKAEEKRQKTLPPPTTENIEQRPPTIDTEDEAEEGKWKAEELIFSADWEDQAETVLKKKDQWINLNADDQADWKAQYFGWDRAFDNFKVFS